MKVDATKSATSEPVMLRAYNGEHKGATAFFRNRPFLDTFIELLMERGPQNRVLFHACSVGAEVYSFAMRCAHSLSMADRPKILATEIDPVFLDIARVGSYPQAIAEGMTAQERSWFQAQGQSVVVPDDIRKMVQFLAPMSFVDGRPEASVDAVLVMNALTYVTPDKQREAIRNIASYSDIIAITAFHPDTIRRDLEENGLKPYLRNQEAIHNAWGKRVTTQPIDPGSPAYSWQVPPFNRAHSDFEFRYGAIFIREDSHSLISA